MLNTLNTEEHTEKNHIAIKNLSSEIENLSLDVSYFLKEINLTEEQLTTFLTDKNNFSSENWSTIIELRKTLDEKLTRELQNIPNPKKTHKTLSKKNKRSHWLSV